MSGRAENMIFVSAEGFFLPSAEGFCAHIEKNHILGLCEISHKKLDFGQVRAASQRVGVAAFCAPK